MLTAIISDIHANHQALHAVIKHAERIAPSVQFWCLGDVFDRGPEPFQVWDDLFQMYRTNRLSEWLAGNHDWGLIGRLGEASFPRLDDRESQRKQRTLLRNTKRDGIVVYETTKDVLGAMPVMLSPAEGVYLAHASFGFKQPKLTVQECVDSDHDSYLWGARQIQLSSTWQKLCAFVKNPEFESLIVKKTAHWSPPLLMAVGHTHTRLMIWLRDLREIQIMPGEWYDLSLNPENPVLINPGSVGFPRNANDACASYALLNWNDKRPCVSFHRVPFDRDKTIALLREYDYPSIFEKELLRGECRT